MIDSGFVFDGFSTKGFGLIVVKEGKRTITAPGGVISYDAAGVAGTLAFGDQRQAKEYPQTVILYADRELGSETDANFLWHKLVDWLTVGRRELIWDSDRERSYMAEVIQITGECGSWIEEGMKVTFLIQPEARAVFPSGTALQMHSGDSVLPLRLGTGLPAPICVSAAVGGTAPLRRMEIQADGRIVRLDGMELMPGSRLEISMEAPAGATILRADGTTVSALPYAERFDRLTTKGSTDVHVQLEFGDGDAACVVRAQARGVWR